MSRVTFRIRNTSGKPVYAVALFYDEDARSSESLTVCSVGVTGDRRCASSVSWPVIVDGGRWFELSADVPKFANRYVLSLSDTASGAQAPLKTLQGDINGQSVAAHVEVVPSDSAGWAIGLGVLWGAWLIVTLIVLILLGVRLTKQADLQAALSAN